MADNLVKRETLEELAKKVGKFHDGVLFSDAADQRMDPLAQHEFLQAVSFLRLAQAAMDKCCLLQARALAQSPLR